ncbi:SIS domain-containing protein [Virgibacillus sp. FSP13]
MINQYMDKIKQLIDTVEKEETTAMHEAAEKIADAIQTGGVIHLFGCGHSNMLAEEVYYRAGGLVPVHPILHEPLMLHEGALRSSELERKRNYAEEFINREDIRKDDVLFALSTSGRNPVPIDVAHFAKEKGAYVVAITSVEYSSNQPSRHESGKHLFEAVDLVIDSHAPTGDAMLSHEKVKVNFSPSSTVIGATILNAVFAESIAIMAENGFEPPVFLSGNIDGADEHNQKLIAEYGDRVKL